MAHPAVDAVHAGAVGNGLRPAAHASHIAPGTRAAFGIAAFQVRAAETETLHKDRIGEQLPERLVIDALPVDAEGLGAAGHGVAEHQPAVRVNERHASGVSAGGDAVHPVRVPADTRYDPGGALKVPGLPVAPDIQIWDIPFRVQLLP